MLNIVSSSSPTSAALFVPQVGRDEPGAVSERIGVGALVAVRRIHARADERGHLADAVRNGPDADGVCYSFVSAGGSGYGKVKKIMEHLLSNGNWSSTALFSAKSTQDVTSK